MKTKILIGVLVIIIAILGFFLYSINENNNTLVARLTSSNNHLCAKQFRINVSDIAAVSKDLESYTRNLPHVDSVTGSYSDPLWVNADTRIHGVIYVSAENGNSFTETYLVYFEENGWAPSAFHLDGQCWIDPPL